MALEQTAIVDELKEQGINEALATGLNFETSEDLTAWVEVYKNALPEVKTIEQYTKEEFEELAKDPAFKGAKGLQGFTDSVRAKAKEKIIVPIPKPTERKPTLEISPELQTQLDDMKAIKDELAKDKFEKNVKAKTKAAGFEDDATAKILKIVKVGDDDAKIDTEIEEMKDFLNKLGVKNFGSPGGGGNSKKFDKLGEDWAKKEKLKKEKFHKKK